MYSHELPLVPRYAIRRLKLQDPWVVNKFTTAYREWIKQHGLAKRAFDLQTKSTYPLSQDDAAEYEWIDRMKIKGLRYADRCCRKLPMGAVPCSPQLQVL
jgi:hypothetical protein